MVNPGYVSYGQRHAKIEYALLRLLERVTARQLRDPLMLSDRVRT